MGGRELPARDELRDYNHAVAGHAGTMCDVKGELFIKPCTQSEIDFYQSAGQHYSDFAKLMPTFMGSLMLSDSANGGTDEAVAGIISEAGNVEVSKDEIVASVTEQIAHADGQAPTADNVTWVPSMGKKIQTDKAVVLENATFGYQRANILDVKLGKRLWADDAPEQKKERFKKISSETTHASLGFRVAGMRVYRGSEDASELDEEEYKVYGKDYGRTEVNSDNVVEELKRFVFNKAAGVDDDMAKAVCAAFARDLAKVSEVMWKHESRMYSTSLLFVFEGDGESLRAAIEENNALLQSTTGAPPTQRTTKRIDSGIGLDESELGEDELEELEELEAALPQIYTLKLIDFAHAAWTPGQGADKNIITGVESLQRIFTEMAK